MANEAQKTAWTEGVGPVWLSYEEDIHRSAERFSNRVMDAANVSAGQTVLDVGCGTGRTTIDLARRVAPGGRAVGLDISELLLDRARQTSAAAGVENVEFVHGDAQTHALEPVYDVVFSRFGVMFFDDPVAAFANLRSALSDTGRLAFVCFQEPAKNVFMSLPTLAAAPVLGETPQPPPPGTPGPFELADPKRVREILGSAGFSDIDVQPFESTIDADEAQVVRRLTMNLRMGPLGDAFQKADEGTREKAVEAVREAAAPYRSDGLYRLPAATWIVVAR